ncbi:MULTISPECIES: helix-turn-helix domain-containing protein [Microbacterium]|uniref:Helix-turn-helix domain-containing protein n=1 Tax=Microbacterium marmarense TaxID=3122051 RepID=A0ABU8LVS7_9MICO
MVNESAASSSPERVLDAGALRALAHPLRVKMYNILSQYGPQTASSLAQQLGESSGSTSYHLRALAKHDLIVECNGRGTGRERWWERPVGSVSFANRDAMTTPAGRAATQVVMGEFLRNRNEELMAFVGRGINAEPDEWHEATLISTSTTQLTAEQTRELGRRLMAIIDEVVAQNRTQTGEGVRAVTIRSDVFPLPDRGELQ